MEVNENDVPENSAAMDIDKDALSGQKTNVNMKPSTTEPSVLASSSVIVPAISVSLHPLVILNISEHWTRLRAQTGLNNIIVIGALLGKQKGREIEMMNSFELKVDWIENQPLIDMDYYKTKELQFKQVFAEMEFLGWYTNGDMPNKNDMYIHKQIIEINESSLFLKLNPLDRRANLPIKIYESIIDLVNGVPTMLFVTIPFQLTTEEAERIVLDHMTRMTSTSNNGDNFTSAVAEHLKAQYSAVKMLRDRLKLILNFVKDTKNKNIPINHEILREILRLCSRLPIIISENFNDDYYIQCNDVALITYLGTLTKCTNSINQYATKFNILIDRQSASRRMRFH